MRRRKAIEMIPMYTKFCKSWQEKVTLYKFLRRAYAVKGSGFDARPIITMVLENRSDGHTIGVSSGQVSQATYPGITL